MDKTPAQVAIEASAAFDIAGTAYTKAMAKARKNRTEKNIIAFREAEQALEVAGTALRRANEVECRELRRAEAAAIRAARAAAEAKKPVQLSLFQEAA